MDAEINVPIAFLLDSRLLLLIMVNSLYLDFNELNTATVSSGMLFVSVESKNQKVIRKCIVLKN